MTEQQEVTDSPMREQIAEAAVLIQEAEHALSVIGDGDWTWQDTMLRRMSDHYRAVLALLRKGPTVAEVFQKEVWCFMCPAPSCRLTEYGFEDRQDADNALHDHLVECHD